MGIHFKFHFYLDVHNAYISFENHAMGQREYTAAAIIALLTDSLEGVLDLDARGKELASGVNRESTGEGDPTPFLGEKYLPYLMAEF